MGIWTDETVDSYDLEDTAKTIFINDDIEGNYMQLLYIAVGIRAIFFQLMTILTFASVMIAALAGSPMFVHSDRLRKCLPAMIIWDSWEKAKEKEMHLTGRRQFENYQWILCLRSISIRITESRAACFFTNFIGILLSLVVLVYSEETKPLIGFLLALLLPFAFGKSMNMIIWVGKGLILTDLDFLHFFYVLIKFGSFGLFRLQHTKLQPECINHESVSEHERNDVVTDESDALDMIEDKDRLEAIDVSNHIQPMPFSIHSRFVTESSMVSENQSKSDSYSWKYSDHQSRQGYVEDWSDDEYSLSKSESISNYHDSFHMFEFLSITTDPQQFSEFSLSEDENRSISDDENDKEENFVSEEDSSLVEELVSYAVKEGDNGEECMSK
jgi:hypothetical protein